MQRTTPLDPTGGIPTCAAAGCPGVATRAVPGTQQLFCDEHANGRGTPTGGAALLNR